MYFSSSGASVPPAEIFYKKPVVLAPGSFGHVDPTHGQIHVQLLAAGVQELRLELGNRVPLRLAFLLSLRLGLAWKLQLQRFPTCYGASMHC